MVRVPLSVAEIDRGRRLGQALREARGPLTMVEIAGRAGVSVETLRKIETGRSPSPEFFTIARLCSALRLPLDDLDWSARGSDVEATAS